MNEERESLKMKIRPQMIKETFDDALRIVVKHAMHNDTKFMLHDALWIVV